MTFTVPQDDLAKKLKKLKRFTTKQEKHALLVEDDESILNLLRELTPIEAVNEQEAEVMLLQLRALSVNDQMSSVVECRNCHTMNDLVINIMDFVDFDKEFFWKNQKLPRGIYSELTDFINNSDVDKLSFNDYGELHNIMEEQNDSFITQITRQCRKCNNNIVLSINPRTSFTNVTLQNIYKIYLNLTMFTNNGILDIDSMYPFERSIYINLIEQKTESKG